MDIKRRNAIIYGLVAGLAIIAITSLPISVALVATKAVTLRSTSESAAMLIVGIAMVFAQLSIILAPWSLPLAAVTGFAAVRSVRASVASLNDAMAVNFIASLIMALTGAIGAFLLFGISVFVSNGLEGYFASSFLICAPALALVLFTLSFFGGMVYSVYRLKLKYVQ